MSIICYTILFSETPGTWPMVTFLENMIWYNYRCCQCDVTVAMLWAPVPRFKSSEPKPSGIEFVFIFWATAYRYVIKIACKITQWPLTRSFSKCSHTQKSTQWQVSYFIQNDHHTVKCSFLLNNPACKLFWWQVFHKNPCLLFL